MPINPGAPWSAKKKNTLEFSSDFKTFLPLTAEESPVRTLITLAAVVSSPS